MLNLDENILFAFGALFANRDL